MTGQSKSRTTVSTTRGARRAMHSPTPVTPSSVVISTSVAVKVSYAPAPKWIVFSALADSAQVARLDIFRLAYPLRGRQANRVVPTCGSDGGG
jgi:hypothetical protein